MNNSASEVGEIFREAGTAFNKLSEMTMLLHPMGDSQPGGKWTDEEIEMLRSCVHRFAVDLNKLSQHIKSRTVSQIRTTLKKKAFEDAGIPVRQKSASQAPANVAQSREISQIMDGGSKDPVSDIAVDSKVLRTGRKTIPRKSRVRIKHTPVRHVVVTPTPNIDEYVNHCLNCRKWKFKNKLVRYNMRRKKLILDLRLKKIKEREESVTLNMLNASENEVDVEGLSGDVKLEFEASTDEMAT